MLRRFFVLALFVAFAAGVSFAASADPAVAERSISIVASEVPGSVKLVFGEASSQDTRYLHVGYGTTDGGDKPAGWDNFVYVADITADMTEYDCVLPSGWGTSVSHVRYFLTTENPDYAVAYEYINFKGNNSNGSYFITDYTPIPSKTHVIADFKLKADRNMALFCSRGASSKPTFTQFFISGTGFRFDCGPETAAKYQAAVKVSVDTQYRVESGPDLAVFSPDGMTIGTASCSETAHTSFTAPTELYLFASHNNRGTIGNCACGEARSIRIYESDSDVYDKSTLVREYLPVLDPNTGDGALYDTVTRKFIAPTPASASYACEFVNPHTYEYVTAGSSESFAFVPRTLEVVSVASEGGTTKATLALSAGNLVSEAIVLALGDYDYGDEPSAWPTNELLSVVSPAAQQLEFEMPSSWNTAAYSSARFFLVHCSPITLQVMESVKGDGSAYIDLGRKGVLGDMVQITASASGTGALFGARESATENCFSVKAASQGGSRDLYLDYSDYGCSRGNYARPNDGEWITFLNSPTERRAYEGTDTSGKVLGGGNTWGDNPYYGDTVTKDFTTPANLRLFDSYNDSDYGRYNGSVKSFALWHIDGGTTNLVMDLVPVRKETTKEAGFYDLVSRKLFTNVAGTGAFAAKGSVQESFITPTVFRPESVAQTMTPPIFASSVRASVTDGSVRIKVTAPEGQTWYASLAYGKTDMGPDPVAWGANTIAGGSGTGSGEVVCALPADWRKTMKAIRVFLSSVAPLMTYEYLKGDGRAYLDLGRKGVFGDMVALKYRHNSGSVGNSVFGARRTDAENDNFSVQAGGNVYVDYSGNSVSRATATGVNTADTTTWLSVISSPALRQIWLGNTSKDKKDKVVTKPFETADNLCLFNIGGYNGNILNACIKDFELRHIEGSVTNDVMRLVPVYVADINEYGMFDEVRGKLLLNANAASSSAFSVDGAEETGLRAYPAYKCSGVSDPVNRGGLILMVR